MGKYFIDEPLPARTGRFVFKGRQGSPFVKCPDAALSTRKKNGGQQGKDVFCGLHAIHPANGTLHAASYACPIIQRFSNGVTGEVHGNGKAQEK
jgi:hypothetical protein